MMLTCLGIWLEMLCNTVIRAVATRNAEDWNDAGLIAASPFFPIAAVALH
jgi:hypothetical protein